MYKTVWDRLEGETANDCVCARTQRMAFSWHSSQRSQGEQYFLSANNITVHSFHESTYFSWTFTPPLLIANVFLSPQVCSQKIMLTSKVLKIQTFVRCERASIRGQCCSSPNRENAWEKKLIVSLQCFWLISFHRYINRLLHSRCCVDHLVDSHHLLYYRIIHK